MEMAKVSYAYVSAIDSGVCSAVSRALGIRQSHNLMSQSRYWMVEFCTSSGPACAVRGRHKRLECHELRPSVEGLGMAQIGR